MENLDPALLASLDPRALEQLLQSMAASMPTGETTIKGFAPSEDLNESFAFVELDCGLRAKYAACATAPAAGGGGGG